jgi:tryptophanyl-tRNA synthetase
MALDDPTAKMSKSAEGDSGLIALLDPPDRIRAKFMRAQTDSGTEVGVEAAHGGVANLLEIYRALTGSTRDQLAAEFDGLGYGQLKARVADATIAALAPIQERYRELMVDPGGIDAILARGAGRARAVAARTMVEVRQRVGLLPAQLTG